MRSSLMVLMLAGAARAQDIADQVDRIVGELRAEVRSRQPANLDKKNWDAWQKTYETLRAAAARKVEQLAVRHAPGGEGRPLDVTAAAEALLLPPLVPQGKPAWAVALRVLRLDIRSPQCWPYLLLLLDEVEGEHGEGEQPWAQIRAWARSARLAPDIGEEAGLALDLLGAHLALELGDHKAARKAAQMILESGAGSDELRKSALAIRSRASLLRAGVEAPGFRIRSIDGKQEYALGDLRGRAVLLFFCPVTQDDFTLERLCESAREGHPPDQLFILTIAPGDDADAIETVRDNAAVQKWPTAKTGELAGQIARAYGADGISALFLIGPGGTILQSSDWDLSQSPASIARMIADSVGPPLLPTLRALGKGSGGWDRFRRFWHGLVRRGRTSFQAETWAMAERIGGRARTALLLANAQAKEAPQTAVGNRTLAQAWWHLHHDRQTSAWERLLKPLSQPRSDGCLQRVDEIYDLGLMGERARAPLEQVAARSTRWQTISVALRALGFQDAEVSPKALRKHLRHKLWQVRLALAEALRAYRHKDAVDLLITLLGDKRTRVRERAARSLTSLTGELYGVSQKRWAAWRRKQGADLRFAPREISHRTPFRDKGHKYAQRGYYGLQVASNHLVFVLDKSESMYYGLFDGVVEEMQAHLAAAGPTTRFNVVEFDAAPRHWKSKLVPANAANLRDAVTFLGRAKPYGPTNVVDSLRMGMQTPGLDAIVLLSDGLPNRGEPKDPKGIIAAIEKENRYTRIAIHTVLLLRGRSFPHDAPRGKQVPPLDAKEKARRRAMRAYAPQMPLGRFLKELAEANDGTFGVGFADAWRPPPGAATRPSSDK